MQACGSLPAMIDRLQSHRRDAMGDYEALETMKDSCEGGLIAIDTGSKRRRTVSKCTKVWYLCALTIVLVLAALVTSVRLLSIDLSTRAFIQKMIKASSSSIDTIFICKTRRLGTYKGTRGDRARRVYDLFLFDSELDWLEIRLAELYKTVDYFIILESNTTFSGKTKPLYLPESWDHFSPWHDKIRHFTLSNLSTVDGTWARERYARNALLHLGLQTLQGNDSPQKDDILLVSDVDEIPRPDVVDVLRLCDTPEVVTLQSEFYYYSFQWRVRHGWNHPQATLYKGAATKNPQSVRIGDKGLVMPNAAWHCSSCFRTIAQMLHKIESYSHQEYNKEEFKAPAWILNTFRFGHDIFNRTSERYSRIDTNLDLPTYILQNIQRFTHLIDRDPLTANFADAMQYLPQSSANLSLIKPA